MFPYLLFLLRDVCFLMCDCVRVCIRGPERDGRGMAEEENRKEKNRKPRPRAAERALWLTGGLQAALSALGTGSEDYGLPFHPRLSDSEGHRENIL